VATAVHAVNATVPLADVRTLEDAYRRSMAQTSFTVTLPAIAAAMALALASSESTVCLATRWQCGGTKSASVWPWALNLPRCAPSSFDRACFSRRSGAFSDLPPQWPLSRWISSLLYGVTALDPLTYALSGATLAGAAMLASVVPARRAAAVDPMETLRSD
jgi:ABC-type antimicrobial peptide transport system permease subunit